MMWVVYRLVPVRNQPGKYDKEYYHCESGWSQDLMTRFDMFALARQVLVLEVLDDGVAYGLEDSE